MKRVADAPACIAFFVGSQDLDGVGPGPVPAPQAGSGPELSIADDWLAIARSRESSVVVSRTLLANLTHCTGSKPSGILSTPGSRTGITRSPFSTLRWMRACLSRSCHLF